MARRYHFRMFVLLAFAGAGNQILFVSYLFLLSLRHRGTPASERLRMAPSGAFARMANPLDGKSGKSSVRKGFGERASNGWQGTLAEQ
jgi:hypothetical protein